MAIKQSIAIWLRVKQGKRQEKIVRTRCIEILLTTAFAQYFSQLLFCKVHSTGNSSSLTQDWKLPRYK